MNKNKNSNKPKRTKIIIIAAIVAVIGIGISMSFSIPNPPVDNAGDATTTNPRTVFWRHIHGLGFDPSDRSILYIGTHGDFFKSVNGGPPVKVDKLRADYMGFAVPMTLDVPLYSSGHPSSGGNMGLVKSIDGGQTWESVSKVLDPPVDFHAMAIGKSDPNVIMGYDSGGRGLFRTTDAGKTWVMVPSDYITALAIDPVDSNVVFVGFAGSQKGIGMSNDGGTSWTLLDHLKGLTVFTLAFDESGTLYAFTSETGLSRSADRGQTWEEINTPKLTIITITIDSQSKIIYIGGYVPEGFQEVHQSTDDGKTWSLIATNKEL